MPIPPVGPGPMHRAPAPTHIEPSPQLKKSVERVTTTAQIKSPYPTFQKVPPLSAEHVSKAVANQISSPLPTYQKAPPSTDVQTRKDTATIFKRTPLQKAT